MHKYLLILGCLFWVTTQKSIGQSIITTVAGDGTTAILNNGIGSASSVVVDKDGNIYVATGGENVVKKITPAGLSTVFAGTSTAGFSGDGAQAADAALNGPVDLYIQDNQLYIADQMNRRIRKVDLATNIISTVAGNGNATLTADGLGATSSIAVDELGNMFISAGGLNVIRKVTPTHVTSTFAGTGAAGYLGDNGLAIAASFTSPTDLCVKEGQLYIADVGNRYIRKIDLTTNIITTIGGDGTDGYTGSGLGATNAVAVDDAGNLFVSTGAAGNLIRQISADGLTYTDLTAASTGGYAGDNGPASSALLNAPKSLFIQGKDLYIADQLNRYIRKVTSVAIALPVKLISFDYRLSKTDALTLLWQVVVTTGIDHFEIQSSTNGKDFQEVGNLGFQTGQQNYQLGTTLPAGITYYRLKIIEQGGAVSFSPVLTIVRNDALASGVKVFPNPTRDQVNISWTATQTGSIQLYLVNTQGQQVYQKEMQVNLGQAQTSMSIRSLASGIYYLYGRDKSGKVLLKGVKIIKQ